MSRSVLPPNASPLLLSFEEAFDKTINFPRDFPKLWNLGEVSEEFLPYLAWTLGVELWPADELVSVEEKRELVSRWIKIRKLRGTRRALELAYEAIGVRGDIIENPDNKKYTIKIRFSSEEKVITPDLRSAVIRLTNLLKPLRVKYEVEIDFQFSDDIQIFGAFAVTQVYRFLGEA
jgi:phage tail P2-like protein